MDSIVRRLSRIALLRRLAMVLMAAEAAFVVIQSITGVDPLPDSLDVLISAVALSALLIMIGSDVVEHHLTRRLTVEANDLSARRREDRAEWEAEEKRRERIENVLDGHAYPTMVFQPIVDLRSERVVGFEALARFGPDQAAPDLWFIQAASVGMGLELELKAIRRALEQLAALPEERQYLSVNCSPSVLVSPALCELLAHHDGHRVVLELTEHVPVDDYGACRRALEPLRELGARLAIDDLGAGYASLRHMIELRPEIIKLDRTLADVTDESVHSMVQALVALAALTGSTVLAEGIEDDVTLGRVREMGVDLGQGWYFGRPGPLPTHSETRRSPPPPDPYQVQKGQGDTGLRP